MNQTDHLRRMFLRARPGSILLELLIVIAIIGVVTAMAIPVFRAYQIRSDLHAGSVLITQALARARLMAQSGVQGSSWSMHLPTGIVFKGDDYDTRDPTFDETFPLPPTISVSNLTTVTFAALTGIPSTTGSVTLTAISGAQEHVDIRIDRQAVAFVEDDSLTICHNTTDNPDTAETIGTSDALWPAHQAHGDTLGACPTYPSWFEQAGCDSPGAGTMYVDDDWADTAQGSDPDGTGPAIAMGADAFASIQPAVTANVPGGRVCIAAGVYTEAVSFNKNLSLVGMSSAYVTLNGTITVGTSPTNVALYGMNIVEASAFDIDLPSPSAVLTLADVNTAGSVSGGSLSGADTFHYFANNGGNVFNLNAATFSGSLAARTAISGIGDININGLGGNDVIRVKPLVGTTVDVDGGDDAGGDTLVLDMTNALATSAQPVVVDTAGRSAKSASTLPLTFTSLEHLTLIDGEPYATTMRDFYLRGTDNNDFLLLTTAAEVNPSFRVRFGNTYFPLPSGTYGPYTTGTSKVYIAGRGGNDTISMYNARLDAAFFGGAGDDILTGGYGNDLITGGAGNDRINGAAVGGNDELWGDDYNPAIMLPSVASQAGGGNDQINSFGGNDTVYGQGGDDIANTGLGNDYVNGGLGNDLIDAQGGSNRVYGGPGNDTFAAGASGGSQLLAGNDGNDTLISHAGATIAIGGLGADTVNGFSIQDALVGDEVTGVGSTSLAVNDAVDAALSSLASAWASNPVLATLAAFNSGGGFASAGNDGSVDTLWGGAGADAFFTTGSDNPADRNAVGYGPDLN